MSADRACSKRDVGENKDQRQESDPRRSHQLGVGDVSRRLWFDPGDGRDGSDEDREAKPHERAHDDDSVVQARGALGDPALDSRRPADRGSSAFRSEPWDSGEWFAERLQERPPGLAAPGRCGPRKLLFGIELVLAGRQGFGTGRGARSAARRFPGTGRPVTRTSRS